MAATPPIDAGAALAVRLADTVPSMLGYWDQHLICRFANRAYERWFGVDPSTLIGTSIRDLLGPDLYAANERHIMAALRGEPQTFERIVTAPGGIQRHSLATYTPDWAGGKVVGFFAQVTEITQLKATEAALRDSERRFRALSEASPFGIFETTADGASTYANARWHEIHGFGPGQGGGHAWKQAIHADDRPAVQALWDALSAQGGDFEHEYRIIRADGEIRTVRARARPSLPSPTAASASASACDAATRYVGALEDVTERRVAEERLRASDSFLNRAGRVAGVGAWEVDLNTHHVTWSEMTSRIHEVDADYQPSIGAGIEFYAPEVRPVVAAAVEAALTHGTPWTLELPLVTAKGRSIWVRTFGEVEYDDAGKPIRLVGAFQDITSQRQRHVELQREQALRQEVERHVGELDRLLQERTEMLDVLAHEVRQPLNNASAALQSASSALADMGEKVASGRLARARTVMGQVLAGIDNTLAVASLLARPEPIQREDTDIDTLIALTVADMAPGEPVRVRVVRGTHTRTASMDMGLMRLALRNLLTNALKNSPPETPVTIHLSDSDEPLALVIDVVDQGRGIPDDLVPHLFQRGARKTQSGGALLQGLGLGLYIVRRVMELHGGRAELARNAPDGVTMRLVVEQSPED